MKILHVVSSLAVGGAEKFVKNLSSAQHKQGHQVSILSFGKESDAFLKLIEAMNIKVITIQEPNILKRFFYLIGIILKYPNIHIHSPGVIRTFLPLSPILLFRNIIYTIHGEVDPHLPLLKLSHQVGRLYINHITAVSGDSAVSVSERYSWNPKNILVVKNGIPKRTKTPAVKEKKHTAFGMVCRLIPLKQIEIAIDAMENFTSSQFKLLIYGDGPERKNLEKYVSNRNLDSTVEFRGFELDEDKIFPNIDILLITSETEGLPMSMLEAMSYSIPVISTKVGAIPKVLLDSASGILIDKNSSSLSEAMASLDSPEKLQMMGTNGYTFVTDHYDIDDVSNTFESLYKREQ